jgi:glycerol-3-phosphate acyltransferase PlsX
MIIAVDAMGGDYAPVNPVNGAVQAAREDGNKLILVGDEQAIRAELEQYDAKSLPIEILHASEVIEMKEPTLTALRSKRDSSIRVCARLVKEGRAQGIVTAGHTGAAMVISKTVIGNVEGVKRPALAMTVPTPLSTHPAVFLDIGANVTCRSIHLVQFAIIGHIFSRDILKIEAPRIGVLSNGEEATKGNELVRQTVDRLSRCNLNFIGPVEGRDLFNGQCDVIVTDGFTGNAVLKAAEGIAELAFSILKEEILSTWVTRLAAMMLRRAFKRLRNKFDYAEYGGALLLGLKDICVICHGRSNPRAIRNAIRIASEFYKMEVNKSIQKGIQELSQQNAVD